MAKKKKLPITKDNVDTIRKRYIIASLRRTSMYWPCRAEAIIAARVDRGLYKCASCTKSFGRKEIQVDHILPTVKLTGFTTWDEYIERLLPLTDGFQILCLACHAEKTAGEQILRKIKKSLDKAKK